MRIAIEGCTHGELEKTYQTLKQIEAQDGRKVDLLICCGDFQSTRNLSDLACMACPDKYKDMCTFYKYYSGEAIAPLLTIFIGGNHEATNYLQELAYGGWVAPNIYYMGYAGVINVNGVRIGGISGIFKGFDYLHGHYERPPYDLSTQRSAYHIRNMEVFRLKQLAKCPPQVMLSHDWPRGVTKHGNTPKLLRYKKHFKDEVEQDQLGSGPTREILDTLQPDYWFSAHLHCKFAALIPHEKTDKQTKFLALDKCLPRRQFLQVLEIGDSVGEDEEVVLKYDCAWLAILRATNHLLSVEKKSRYPPGPGSSERWDFTPTDEELAEIEKRLGGDMEVPYNFEQTALAYKPAGGKPNLKNVPQPQATTNRQTTLLCSKLGIYDPMALILGTSTTIRPSMGGLTLAGYSQEDSTLGNQSSSRLSKLSSPTPLPEKCSKIVSPTSDDEVDRKAKLAMPAPKEEASNIDFLAVLDSIGANKDEPSEVTDNVKENVPVKSSSDMFVIDTQGQTQETQMEVGVSSVRPQLKRRNASMYREDDD